MGIINKVNQKIKGVTTGIQDFAKSIPTVATPDLGKITSNYDYLIGDEYKFKGTVHAGGQSYSGADIKVVVTLNRQFDAEARQLQKDVEAKREDYEKFQETSIEALRAAQTGQINSKFGTSERNNYLTAANRARSDANNAKKALDSLNDVKLNSSNTNTPVTKVLAECQTLSLSVFRDKAPVRSLGSVYPKGFTRGPRQIGGSLVFTVFDRDVLYDFLAANPSDFDGNRSTSAVLDQLPPVDILIAFASELGSVSRMAIYGVEFMSQGQLMSIEDLITENTVEYVARDFDPMQRVGIADFEKSNGRTITYHSESASQLIYEDDYQDVKNALDPFERFKRRNTRFL